MRKKKSEDLVGQASETKRRLNYDQKIEVEALNDGGENKDSPEEIQQSPNDDLNAMTRIKDNINQLKVLSKERKKGRVSFSQMNN